MFKFESIFRTLLATLFGLFLWFTPAYAETPEETPAAPPEKAADSLDWDNDLNSSQQDVEEEADEADPHQGSRTWLAPPPRRQRERSAQLPSMLKGGIFVPAMSPSISEPKYRVLQNDKVIEENSTGTTTYVEAGDYTVIVGTPVTEDAIEFDVHVLEGVVTTVPVEWSGLIVKVVNDHGATIHGNYEIVSLPERSYIGLGSGMLINEGERLTTWILWPGKYMIISAGEGYQARKNFITVKLEPGQLSRITLVLDEDSGDILGGGEVEEVIRDDEHRWWWAGAIVGGSVRFNRTDDVVGKATGQALDVSGFLESYFTLGLFRHFLYMRLNAEIGGAIRFEDRPFVTSVDELSLEILYTYRVVDWFGPYVRFSFESNMAPTNQELASPYTVIKRDSNDGVISTSENATNFKLAPPFSPIQLNAGAGGRLDLTFGSWFKLNARIGVAYRHVFTRDLFIVFHTDNETHTITLDEVTGDSRFGLEGALNLDITPIQWFTLKVESSILEPFDDWKDPIIDLDVDAALRLSSIASISYTLRLNYDVQMLDKVQLDQYIQLRFSYKIL